MNIYNQNQVNLSNRRNQSKIQRKIIMRNKEEERRSHDNFECRQVQELDIAQLNDINYSNQYFIKRNTSNFSNVASTSVLENIEQLSLNSIEVETLLKLSDGDYQLQSLIDKWLLAVDNEHNTDDELIEQLDQSAKQLTKSKGHAQLSIYFMLLKVTNTLNKKNHRKALSARLCSTIKNLEVQEHTLFSQFKDIYQKSLEKAQSYSSIDLSIIYKASELTQQKSSLKNFIHELTNKFDINSSIKALMIYFKISVKILDTYNNSHESRAELNELFILEKNLNTLLSANSLINRYLRN